MKLGIALVALNLTAATVWTSQGDNLRNNYNPAEITLTASTIKGVSLLASLPVDGAVWGQPLVFNGGVFVCTMHNSCYSFNERTLTLNWHVGPFAPSITIYPDNGGHINYGQEVGCLSTPVIDTSTAMLYAVCGNSTPAWVLYQIDATTGVVVNSSVISGSVVGTGDTGDCTSGSNLLFCPGFALQRAGLALSNGVVYVAFSSYGDFHPFHGWLMAYSTATLSQTAIFCITPNSYGGSIWQGAGAPAVDESGNVYVTTGNGGYNGTTDFSMSALKLSPSLALLDHFTPANWSALSVADLDLASGRVMLIPGVGRFVFGAKDFNVYSLNTQCLSCSPQIFVTNPLGGNLNDGIFGGVFGAGMSYWPTVAGSVYSFPIIGSTWSITPVVSAAAYPFPGAQMTLAGGILWAVTGASSAESSITTGTLRALNPATLAELWNSGTYGNLSKFAAPTIANGRVYVPTLDSTVRVYGLAPPATLRRGTLRHGKIK